MKKEFTKKCQSLNAKILQKESAGSVDGKTKSS
jgi:hypothetical protein